MSPSSPTVRPSIRPLARRIVIRSKSPWVGCSWAPSPALMIEHLTCCASRCGVPGVGWRITRTSAPIASMFLAVSMNDSPFERLEPLGEKSCVSADSRLAARLKLVRVRVEFSKNKLKTIRPLESGNLLAAARRDLGERLGGIQDRQDLLARQIFQTQQMLAAPGGRVRTGAGRRCDRHGAGLLFERERVAAPGDLHDLLDRIDGLKPHSHMIAAVGRDVQPDHVGLNRDLAMAAVDQRPPGGHTRADPGRRSHSARREPSGP